MPRKPVVTMQDEPFEDPIEEFEKGMPFFPPEDTDLDPPTVSEGEHIKTAITTSVPSVPAPTGTIRYQSRIHIVDAWQYKGFLGNAPAFVDRNWAAWGEYDPDRDIEPGPALRVPTPGPRAEKMARAGDYIVRQTVTIAEGVPAEEQIDVWTRDEFERFFLPTREPSHEDAPQVP